MKTQSTNQADKPTEPKPAPPKPSKVSYDINEVAKKLRRSPKYLAEVIRNGGMTPHLAEKVSALTGLSLSYLIHRKYTGGGKARIATKRRGSRQRTTAKTKGFTST